MPVRSSDSSVLKWPDAPTVRRAFEAWAAETATERRELVAAGYFGSYATGNWGVGSDLDVVLIVADSDEPFEVRAGRWDLTSLPVPVETLVYTVEEWQALQRRDDRFSRMLGTDTVWVIPPEVA